MAQDWDIKPRATECRECMSTFSDGQRYWSALFRGEDGFVRVDHCESCWNDVRAHAVPHSSWRGIFQLPPPPEAETLQKETAESLLRRLMEQDDDQHVNSMFILAIMLERKRLFVERDVKVDDNGGVTRVYEHRKTGETFLIPDPQLRLEELESVQKEVALLLGGKRESPNSDA